MGRQLLNKGEGSLMYKSSMKICNSGETLWRGNSRSQNLFLTCQRSSCWCHNHCIQTEHRPHWMLQIACIQLVGWHGSLGCHREGWLLMAYVLTDCIGSSTCTRRAGAAMSPNLLFCTGEHACTPHVLWERECTHVSLDGEVLKFWELLIEGWLEICTCLLTFCILIHLLYRCYSSCIVS